MPATRAHRAPEPDESGAYSVSDAMQLAKHALESVTVRIVGEVSEVKVKPTYKAAYFTVKDSSSALPCMMWNNRYRESGIALKVGQRVQLTGRFTLYAAKGRMNFDVFSIELDGEGQLRLQVAQLARKLEAEGLTAPERKRPLPRYPERIGLVTSPHGAAVEDVLRTLRRRFNVAKVLVAGVPVEGAAAPAAVVRGIVAVVEAGAEVVLVVRGGGSFEDLMPFNDERLARTIARCPVPVVTGVGHEVDTTIVDLVSDYRASTPTGAAEAVSPSEEALASAFARTRRLLSDSIQKRLVSEDMRLERIENRPLFSDPQYLLADAYQGVDEAADRLATALPRRIERDAAQLATCRGRLRAGMPRLLVGAQAHLAGASSRFAASLQKAGAYEQRELDAARAALVREGPRIVEGKERAVARQAAQLDDLSPSHTLARGYAVARTDAGTVVRHVAQAPAGSTVNVAVSDGVLHCAVRKTELRSASASAVTSGKDE